MTARQQAKRTAAGETYFGSSIARTPQQAKKKHAKPRKAITKKPRSKAERERIYGPPGRVEFVKSLACVVCTALSPHFGRATAGYSHNAHTVTGGKGRKADYTTIVPLCASHHRMYDEHRAPLDTPTIRQAIKDAAAEVERRWLAASSSPSSSPI